MQGLELQVELVCEETKSTKLKRLTLQSEPHNFLDIKRAIEKSFSIPVCVQSLLHQSNKVTDTDTPSQCYLRDGDTLQVTYPTEGECERVIEVVKWLKKLEEAVLLIRERFPGSPLSTFMYNFENIGYHTYKMLVSGVYNEMARDLSLNLVYPWTSRTKYVNKLHFDSLDGVKHLISVYKFLVDARHNGITVFRGHFMEMVCALFVANFTQTFPLRRRIIEHGGLDLCVKTFLCSPVSGEGNFRSSCDAIEVSLYAVCNLSELPECQASLAQKVAMTDQALQVAISPAFTCKTAIVSASYLLCLAQCRAAQVHLLKPSLVGRMLEMCEKRRRECEVHGYCDPAMALECYTSVVIAQMSLGTSEHVFLLWESLLIKIMSLMESVCAVDPVDVRAYEIKEGLVWGTFLPYITYLYDPKRLLSSELLVKLHQLSTSVLLHALKNALGRDAHVKILLDEGLLEYVVALPWHVPESCRTLAMGIRKEVSKFVQIRPPSLCSLAKAKLAKSSTGLKRVLDMRSVSDLFSVLTFSSNLVL